MGPKQKRPFDTKEINPATSDYADFKDFTNVRTPTRDNVALSLSVKLDDCRQAVLKVERGFREELCNRLQDAFKIAQCYMEHEEAWTQFCGDEFWLACKSKRPKPTDGDDAIIAWVVRYIFRVTTTEGPRYNRAYKYWRTLQGYRRIAVPADEISERLQHEGSEYAFTTESRENPRQRPAKAKNATASVAVGRASRQPNAENEVRSDDDEDTRNHALQLNHPQRQTSQLERLQSKNSYSIVDNVKLIEIEVDERQLATILNLQFGEHAWLRFKHVDTLPTGWKRFVATKIKSD